MLDLAPKSSPVRVSFMLGYQFAEDRNLEPATVAPSSHQSTGQNDHHATRPQETSSHPGTPSASHKHSHKIKSQAGHHNRPLKTVAVKESHHTTNASAGQHQHPPQPPENQPEKATQAHDHEDGTHQHGASGWHARLIAEMDLTDSTKAVANLVFFDPEQGKPAWGYALGLREMLTKEIGVGFEAVGELEDLEGSHEVMLGTYFSPCHDFTVKAGVGLGLTSASPEVTTRLGLVWRF
jgi:hypothetical protein